MKKWGSYKKKRIISINLPFVFHLWYIKYDNLLQAKFSVHKLFGKYYDNIMILCYDWELFTESHLKFHISLRSKFPDTILFSVSSKSFNPEDERAASRVPLQFSSIFFACNPMLKAPKSTICGSEYRWTIPDSLHWIQYKM